jgi:hypothetical protein
MSYKKPQVVAANNPSGSYAAGCPEKDSGSTFFCHKCERTK